jgi:hypothetical protein
MRSAPRGGSAPGAAVTTASTASAITLPISRIGISLTIDERSCFIESRRSS